VIRRTAPPGRTGRLCQGPNFADRGDRFLAHIFVSYARNDKSLVAPLVAAISHELEGAHTVVVVWTAGSVDSRWVRGKARDAAHQGQGRYDVGHDACEEALRLDPDSYDGNRVAGMCCIALARVEKVIAAEPDHGRALGYSAGLLATLGEPERAKEWFERGTLLDPDNTSLHFNFVCALARLREVDAALELLATVIDKASQGWLMWLDADTDLDPLRGNPRFAEIVQQAKARFAAE